MSFIHAARTRLRLLFARRAAESRMEEEMRFHVDMEADRLAREEGLAPDEARRRARLAFGLAERYKDEMRDGRGLSWMGGLGLDLKLGLRMMAKYPGLSLIAVVGMAVAIAIGAGAFTMITEMTGTSLPLNEGERIVSIQNTDTRNGAPDRRVLHDFALWRGRLTQVRDLGAFYEEDRTIVLPNRRVDVVEVANMSAAGFRVARVAPYLGRPLLDDDEREDAPPVLVIAYEEWQRRFEGDPGIIGRNVRIGNAEYTIVGVMPAGFRFPVNHLYWAPLRADPADYEAGDGPWLRIFGRLAPGATLEDAQAEIMAVGPAERATRTNLRPFVLPYTRPYSGLDNPGMAITMYGIQLAISLLLVVVAVNVSVLVYARTASRLGEIAVRTALGASRGRVAGQLFAEALVLTAIAAAIGLALTQTTFAIVESFQGKGDGEPLPFWIDFGLSPGLVLYVVALTLLASVIVGVLPALKATGRDVSAGLKELASRGSRMQLGRTWTSLIVGQVAIAVAVLPYAGFVAGQALQRGLAEPTFPMDRILRARVRMEETAPPPLPDSAARAAHERAEREHFVSRVAELMRRLEAEPAVDGVTYSSGFPGQEWSQLVETEWGETRQVQSSSVDIHLLDVLGVSMLTGRGLATSDYRDAPGPAAGDGNGRVEASGAIANRAMVEWLRSRGNATGQRLRFVNRYTDRAGREHVERGPWIEVVGVMPDFTVQAGFDPAKPKVYTPAPLAAAVTEGAGVSLALRVRGADAASFAERFRAVTAALDPALRLDDLRTAANQQHEEQMTLRLVGLGVTIATLSVLLLSAAGIYAMMSFTVERRRREIGIRTALGADARRVLGSIFARASAQIGAGVLIGMLIAALVNKAGGGLLAGERLLLLPVAAAFMLVIGLGAAFGPARKGLAVQPTEALREE